MLMITRSKSIPVDQVPSVFVEDKVYLMLSFNQKMREQILSELKVNSLVVDRLGKNIKESTYRKESAEIYESVDVLDKEVGLYLEL